MTTEEQELKEATQVTKGIIDIIGPDIVDLEKELISDEEKMMAACAAEIFYKKYFEKRLKLIVYKNLKRNGASETIGTALFFKGALFGLEEIQEWFEKQISFARSRFDDNPKDEDPSNPIDSITD